MGLYLRFTTDTFDCRVPFSVVIYAEKATIDLQLYESLCQINSNVRDVLYFDFFLSEYEKAITH